MYTYVWICYTSIIFKMFTYREGTGRRKGQREISTFFCFSYFCFALISCHEDAFILSVTKKNKKL